MRRKTEQGTRLPRLFPCRCRLPEIPAVNDDHLDLVEVEIVEQARIDADLRIVEIRLAARPVGCFGSGDAAACGAKAMVDGLRATEVERDVFGRAGELELLRNVVRPKRAALRAEGTCALRHGLRRLRNLECRRLAVAASLDGHERIPLRCPPRTAARQHKEALLTTACRQACLPLSKLESPMPFDPQVGCPSPQ